MLKKTSLLISLILLFSFTLHKYYVSLTDVEYNTNSQSIQIITNVFIDDLELTLNEEFKIDAQLTTKDELKNIDSFYKKYLQKHLTFTINESSYNFDYLGKEYQGDIVYFYLEIPNVKKLNSVKIENHLLIKYFKDQQNIVKVKSGSKRKSKILNHKTTQALLTF